MFWVALAAGVTAPAPDLAKRWLSYKDTPQFLIRQGPGLWTVPVRVTVDPTGRIQSCRVEAIGTVPQLNDHTCGLIRRRARFRPATIAGVPAYGVYRTKVPYLVADAPRDMPKVSGADIDVQLDRLPAGLTSPKLVKVAFAVDTNGHKSSCEADETGGRFVSLDPALVAFACDRTMKEYQATAAIVSRQPVVSVQNASVQFTAPVIQGK
jgi:hypothetical protein